MTLSIFSKCAALIAAALMISATAHAQIDYDSSEEAPYVQDQADIDNGYEEELEQDSEYEQDYEYEQEQEYDYETEDYPLPLEEEFDGGMYDDGLFDHRYVE